MRVRDGHVVPVPLFVALAVAAFSVSQAEILTPPYFNLATGRKITATATCGEDTEGPELYCKLVGANADSDVNNVNLIQGQVHVISTLLHELLLR